MTSWQSTITTLREALQAHQRIHMPARNYAEKTRRGYGEDLRDLLRFLEGQGRTKPGDVTPSDLEAYLAQLDRRGLAGATRRRKVYACKSLFTYLHRAGHIPHNPTEGLVAPRSEQKEPRVLSVAEYQALLRACSHHSRDAAILELLLQTGIRLSELVGLQLSDVELPGRITKEVETVGRLHILAKGRKTRWIPLNYKACRAMKSWLDVRPEGTSALFITKFGQPIGPRAIQHVVHKYLAEAGVSGASVHTLRHTFATQHVAKGTSLRTVQEGLGHASLKTTSIYVQLAQEAVKRELQEHAL
jgi:site-specific recombinase XerD